MPPLKITIRKLKDGREVARFRDSQGLVRTSLGMTSRTIATDGFSAFRDKWTRADQIRELAEYGIQLQKDQVAAGLGSDGTPMPPLKVAKRRFVARQNGVAQFSRNKIRNLYGTGVEGGHMLDFIRVNYLDDQRATIAITSTHQREKARGNERRAPWWGWSPDSVRKLTAKAAEIFQTGTAEYLYTMGLIGANALADAKRLWRKVA
jgi:hypothetical protein